MSKKYIIGNWKQYITTLAQAQELVESLDEQIVEKNLEERILAICPPFVFTEEVAKLLATSRLAGRVALGTQDIALDEAGALTGEISGPMLTQFNVRYVIVGHSERRWKLGESDAVVNQKLKEVLKYAMVPIVCVGERERDAGFKDFLREQLEATFAGIPTEDQSRCIIAYEPVWAISSNPGARPDTPESAVESIDIIRAVIPGAHYLYGGSVTASNAGVFLNQPEIDGVLVGSASTKKEEFAKIITQ